MPVYQFYREQVIPASRLEVWDFISSPENLKKITPPEMGFDITSSHLSEKMYPGMIISYKVKPLPGIKTNWVTEITQVREGEYFVDEQRVGPYRIWHHQHILDDHEVGILMKDLITYLPPLGLLGAIANRLVIRGKLEEIFAFRENAIMDVFGQHS
jgi:ligand-binding SRPBCC domain-containing protein